MNKTFHEKSWEDYVYWQTQDRKTLKRINLLLNDIVRNGYDGIGKPEPLKSNLSGWWSRRINEEDRLVYRIKNDTIEILMCKGHIRFKKPFKGFLNRIVFEIQEAVQLIMLKHEVELGHLARQ